MKRKVRSEDNNKNLVIISKILSRNGIEFFPFYGTLLGLVRENSCIDGDDDIDIMVNIKDKSKVVKAMSDLNLKNSDSGEHFLQFTYRIGKNPVLADFYFFEERGDVIVEKWNFYGKEFHENYNIHYNMKDIFPLKELDWNGIKINIPNDPESIVRYCYGEQWNVPKNKNNDYVQVIVNNRIVVKYGDENV